MQTDRLFEIWDRFDRSDIAELEIENGTERIVLRRNPAAYPSERKQMAVPAACMNQAKQPGDSVSENKISTREEPAMEKNSRMIRTPLVGTFYRAASPEAEPYVSIGQKVRRGDVVGIVEAMKMMNEITAPCDGTISRILVEDETLVEYDQVLMCIGEENEKG